MTLSVEIAAATVPLKQMLGLAPLKPINEKSLRSYIKQVTENVDRFYTGSGSTFESELVLADVAEIKHALSELDESNLLTELLQQLMTLEVSIGVGEKVVQIDKYLQDALPLTQAYSPVMLTVHPTASKSEDIHFLWKCRVAESASLQILSLMSMNQLTKFDVQCFETLYPESYQALIGELIGKLPDHFSMDNPPPRRIRLMLAVLLKTPLLDLKTLQAYKTPEPKAAPTKLNVNPEI